MALRAAIVLAALLLALPAAAGTAPLRSKTFRTPSRNIACAVYVIEGVPDLRCDVLSGLRPEPSRRCDGDWTGASMRPRGRAGAVCAGDTVYDPRAPVLAYGRTWERSGFRCRSRHTGLTCANRSKHGFLLARERWRLF
ncbi:MAG: DUF6636 domain-containing protein [Gaiellaceae bacterium]